MSRLARLRLLRSSAYDEQRHFVAAQQSTILRSGAQAYLSEVAAACPLIREAVRASAFQGLVVPPKADLADFPTSALTEAATALGLQRAGLRLLSTSAQAGASHAGARGTRAVAQLGDGFDLYASRLIEDGMVRIALSPEDVALGVLPLLPLALHLWFRFHTPSAAAPSSVVSLAEKMVFMRRGQLDFSADLDELNIAFAQATGTEDDFDLPLAYGNLVRSMATSRDFDLVANLRSGEPCTWRAYVDLLVESFSLRIHRGHRATPLTLTDFDALLRDLDAFAARLVDIWSTQNTVATMRPPSHGAAFVVPHPKPPASLGTPTPSHDAAFVVQHSAGPASMGPSPSAQPRPSTGYVACNLVAYPDIRSIEELVRSAPSTTEIWVNPHLVAWDCAKLPDLVQARLGLLSTATSFAEFLASRLPEEPEVDHSFMLVQGLRRGCIRLRPEVHAAYAVAPSLFSAPVKC